MPRHTRRRTHRRKRSTRRHGGAKHTWGSRARQVGKWGSLAGIAAAGLYGINHLKNKKNVADAADTKTYMEGLKEWGINVRNARGKRAVERLKSSGVDPRYTGFGSTNE